MIIKTKKTPQIGMLPSSIHIPNSIRVTTRNDEVPLYSHFFLNFKYFFTNFTNRKDTYHFLSSLWTITVDEMFEIVEYR
jgi:hypothetical protein